MDDDKLKQMAEAFVREKGHYHVHNGDYEGIWLAGAHAMQDRIEQHRGALGYSVHGHIAPDPDIRNGIADALSRQLAESEARHALELRQREDDAARALRESEAAAARMRDALEWYADEENHVDGCEPLSCGCCSEWKPASIEADKGARARAALAPAQAREETPE